MARRVIRVVVARRQAPERKTESCFIVRARGLVA